MDASTKGEIEAIDDVATTRTFEATVPTFLIGTGGTTLSFVAELGGAKFEDGPTNV